MTFIWRFLGKTDTPHQSVWDLGIKHIYQVRKYNTDREKKRISILCVCVLFCSISDRCFLHSKSLLFFLSSWLFVVFFLHQHIIPAFKMLWECFKMIYLFFCSFNFIIIFLLLIKFNATYILMWIQVVEISLKPIIKRNHRSFDKVAYSVKTNLCLLGFFN